MKDTEDEAMSVLFADAKTHKILDPLPVQRLHHLDAYFRHFPLKTRIKVDTVTDDLRGSIEQGYRKGLLEGLIPKVRTLCGVA